MPLAVQLAERSFHQRHLHGRGRGVRILGSKALADAVVVDLYGSHQPIGPALAHLDSAAPWQKRWVILYPVNQGKHLLSAISKQD